MSESMSESSEVVQKSTEPSITGNGKATLAIGDRVRRVQGVGCLGTVLDVRTEVAVSTLEMKERGLIVAVHWDNGTTSFFGPEGLEKAVAK